MSICQRNKRHVVSRERLRPMNIGNIEVTNDGSIYFIAEISANHCMDQGVAVELIRACAKAGANAVKFQTFTAAEIAADGIKIQSGYNMKHDKWLASLNGRDTLRDLLADGGLPRRWHKELKHVADDCGIHFLSTPFSVDAAKFLAEEIGVPAIKIASGDLTFRPLLDYVATLGLPIILSTGGSYLSEIWPAVYNSLHDVYIDGNLSILHCTSSYPLNPSHANLLAIQTLASQFDSAIIGYSDHTTHYDWFPVLAVMMGANIYEKHVKPDYNTVSNDAQHSIVPEQFAAMVSNVKAAIRSVGNGQKIPHAAELHDRLWARRDPSDWLRPTMDARNGRWE
jgi:sialic acid synthase SpsE